MKPKYLPLRRKQKIAGLMITALATAGLGGCSADPYADPVTYNEAYGVIIDKEAWATTELASMGRPGTIAIKKYHYAFDVEYQDMTFPSGIFQETWRVSDSVYNICEIHDYFHRSPSGIITCSKEKLN